MRILYVNCSETNRPWGAECAVGAELRRRGHDVIDLDYRRERPRLCRMFADGFEKAVQPDVVFLQRAEAFPVEVLEALRSPIVYWATEVWWKEQHNPLLQRLDLFQHVWVHNEATLRQLEQDNSDNHRNVSVLNNGYDDSLHRPGPERRDQDVLFYGSLNRRRLGFLRRLRRLNVEVVSQVFGEALADAIRRSKVVVNIHYGEACDFESRVLEVLGSGACLVTEPLSSDAAHCGLRDGEHYVSFHDASELSRTVQELLEDEERRARIAQRGLLEAQARHTWRHRCDIIDNQLDGFSNVVADPPQERR